MIDIVFDDNSCISLQIAQHFGDGEYNGGEISVFFPDLDDSEPTEEEIQAAQQEAEEEDRLEWECATPMGGDPDDVFGFDIELSIGDISENVPDGKQDAKDDLKEVCRRISTGEDVRIWYSNQPDELCGLYWFMAQLNQIEQHDGQVFLVPLPEWNIDEDGDFLYRSVWDGIRPRKWHDYLDLQKTAPPAFCKECAAHWKFLQQENALLRVLLNGRLVSAPISFYDEFISHEIAALDDEFDEPMLIGTVMEKYQIRDAFIAQRIESMICTGSLVPVTKAAPNVPTYHRRLKKVH